MKKSRILLLGLTAAFVCIMIGIFIGRNMMSMTPALVREDRITDNATESAFQDGKINLNTAGVTDFVMLPGIGEGIAKRIIAYRQSHGPFSNIEDIMNVEGIGPTRFKAIEQYITVGG